MRRLAIAGTVIAALAFGTVSCGEGGPSATCVDWDTKKVTKTVTPKAEKVRKKVWDTAKRKYVWKWVDGKTPAPYKTTVKTRYCDEWETESPTPTNS
jgi:hypothetical protein